MRERINHPSQARVLAFLCFVAYCALYSGRLNLSACIANMVSEDSFGKAELGTVVSCFFLAYGIMQVPGGLMGDRFRASRLVEVGLVGAAAVNLLFPLFKSMALMRILWTLNGMAQALVWPALMHILSDVNQDAPPDRPLMSIATLSASSPAGALIAYGACALILRYLPWRMCFSISGAVLAIMAAAWHICTARTLSVRHDEADVPKSGDHRQRFRTGFRKMAGIGFPILAAVAFFHGLLKDGLITWIPTYLVDTLSLSPDRALLITMLLPAVNLAGVYLADLVNRRFFHNELTGCAFFFGVTFVSVLMMVLVFSDSIPGTVLCLATVSCLMMAVNMLVVSIVPLHFENMGTVATVAGVLDGAIYLGNAVSSTLFGWIAETGGWNGTRFLWCACALLGVICSAAYIGKWRNFRRNQY